MVQLFNSTVSMGRRGRPARTKPVAGARHAGKPTWKGRRERALQWLTPNSASREGDDPARPPEDALDQPTRPDATPRGPLRYTPRPLKPDERTLKKKPTRNGQG